MKEDQLVNGEKHTGANDIGDEDLWTFEAEAGDNLVLRIGKVSGDVNYSPWINLYGPDGALIDSQNDSTSDTRLELKAESSGIYSLLVSSFLRGNEGSYALHFFDLQNNFTVQEDDEGGPLVTGANHPGLITIGDEDTWTFQAEINDVIYLTAGKLTGDINFSPRIELYGPNGNLLDSADASLLSHTSTTSAQYTVLLGSSLIGFEGTYNLRYLQIPGDIGVPDGDEGGRLVNGDQHDGMLEDGDEDAWQLQASEGDELHLRVVDLNDSNAFNPQINLYGPDGSLLTSGNHANDSLINYSVADPGLYTVAVHNTLFEEPGNYRLRLAQVPRGFVIPEEDEGGRLNNGITESAVIDLGDIDIWTFEANTGNDINLKVDDLSGSNAFVPALELYDPAGNLMASTSGNLLAELNEVANTLGTYTALVMSNTREGNGDYQIRLTKTPPDLSLPLTVGESLAGSFSADGDRAYYVVDVPEGSHLSLSLNDLDDLGFNEVYLKRGSPPTAGDFDARFAGPGADQQIFVPDANRRPLAHPHYRS